jgi:putative polymerase
MASTKNGRSGVSNDGRLWPFIAFGLLCLAMFLNLILAFLHARGLPASTNLVIVAQIIVTAFALPAFASRNVRLREPAIIALAFIAFSALVTNFLNPFNAKAIYDCLLIPIFIGLGLSASYVRPQWMNWLLLFVLATVLMENFFPSIYASVFDPAGYFSATREWVANAKENAASADGLYRGAYRGGGSQLSFADHRISGAFLEPLSLGYFSVLMAIYYTGLHRGSLLWRAFAVIICLGLALASDSRISTALILTSALFLTLRPRLPVIVLWLTFPVIALIVSAIYFGSVSSVYGDTSLRLGLTFQALGQTSIGAMIVGMVPLGHANDSGIVYLLRCVGLFGLLMAIWFYSGAFTYRKGASVAFLVMVAVYLSISLVFGGASLSIKTASLLGYLVGVACAIPIQVRTKSTEDSAVPHDTKSDVLAAT